MVRISTRLVSVIIAVLLVAVAAEGFLYLSLKTKHDSFVFEYEQMRQQSLNISATLSSLAANLTSLMHQYESIRTRLSQLEIQHQSLTSEYNRITSSYSSLAERYNLLAQIIDRPLMYGQVPTLEELKTWLSEDDTDEFEYREDFNCLDFSLSLSIRARSKGWKMGVIFIRGFDNITLQRYVHVFNAISASDGLVYVEPINDQVWWYEGHGEIKSGEVFVIAGKPIMVEGIETIVAHT